MVTWRHDLRSALRSLRRSPGFTLTTVLSTALGVGMATFAFGLADTLLLQSLPFPDADRLVAVAMERPVEEIAVPSLVSYPEFLDFAALSRCFTGQAVYAGVPLPLLVRGSPELVLGAAASADLFRVLGVAPRLGRVLSPDDERPDAPAVVLIGDSLWRRSFGADPGIVGKSVLVNEIPTTVIGVMPPGFAFPVAQEAWVPLPRPAGGHPPRDRRDLRMIARLRPGVSVGKAREEIEEIGRRLAARYPETTAERRARLQPLRSNVTPELRLIVRYVGGAAAFILLIAGANLFHLLLVRGAARRQEMAIRAAFGAGPRQIARQIFSESALLAGAGGALGAVLAAGLLARVETLLADTPWIRIAPELPVLLCALGVTALFALLLGLPAGLDGGRTDLSPALKQTSDGGRPRQRLRAALVVSEIAVTVILLTGASLTLRSLLNLQREPGGVHVSGLLTLRTMFPGPRYADGAARARRIDDILARLRAIPGVEAAAAANDLPNHFTADPATLTVGDPRLGAAPAFPVSYATVSSDYFRALGAPLRSGRDLTPGEIAAGAAVAVVNQTLARAAWPGKTAVGKLLWLRDGPLEAPFTVTGVVADIRQRLLSQPAAPEAYIPLPYSRERAMGLLLRTKDDPERLTADVTRRIHGADPRLPVFGAATLDEVRTGSIFNDRQRTQAALLCAGVALLLALLGVYSVLSYSIGRQLRGIGIRLALGATRWHVMRRLLGYGLALTLAGIVLGLAGSLAVGRFLDRFLYQVSPADPVSFLGIALLVFDAAFIACYLPARRVLELDPVAVLREV